MIKLRVLQLTVYCFVMSVSFGQTDSLSSNPLKEVVITATKFPTTVTQTAKVLTIIDKKKLSQSTGKSLSQLINEQSGIVVNGSNSNPSKDKSVYLRGAGNGYTVIMIDGIPLNDPSGLGGAYDLRLISIDQIERIEILKGSQSTLYGTDAIAGIINIISKKKGTKIFGGNALASYGSYNSFKGAVSFAGSTTKFDYRLGYSHSRSGGFSEAIDSTNSARFDRDGYTQDALQLNLGYSVNEKFTLRPYFRYSNFLGMFDAGAFADADNSYSSFLLNSGFTAKYNLAKGSINFLYGYDLSERKYIEYNSLYKGKFHHGELFLNQEFTNHFQAVAGVSYQNMVSESNEVSSALLVSPYISFHLKKLRGFSVELGSRISIHDKFGNNLTYNINPSFLLGKHFKFYANVGTGFKTPTLSQLYGKYGANPNLKPERSSNFEAGSAIDLANNKITLNLTAYLRNISSIIFYSKDPISTEPLYINLNKETAHGFEAEVSAILLPELTVSAFYNFVDGYQIQYSDVKEVKTRSISRRPKNSFGLSAHWQPTSQLVANVNLRTYGKRADNYFATPTIMMHAYSLLDIYLEYTVTAINGTLFVDLKNSLNQDYMEINGYNTMGTNIMGGINVKF